MEAKCLPTGKTSFFTFSKSRSITFSKVLQYILYIAGNEETERDWSYMMCVYWGPVNFLDHFASRDFGLVLKILRLVYKEVFLLYCIEWFLSYVDLYVALPHIRVEKQFFEIVCKGYQKKCTDFKKVYNSCVKKCPTIFFYKFSATF
jgi:hypothetical protein